jgi:hypothetical protein
MSSPRLVELYRVQDALPVSLSSIYSQVCRGNWTWATRIGPDGRRGRRLWVDIDALGEWAQTRGLSLDLPSYSTQTQCPGQGGFP